MNLNAEVTEAIRCIGNATADQVRKYHRNAIPSVYINRTLIRLHIAGTLTRSANRRGVYTYRVK